METYGVPFIGGQHGTWLWWFINEHRNFINIDRLHKRTVLIDGTERVTDYAHPFSWFHPMLDVACYSLPDWNVDHNKGIEHWQEHVQRAFAYNYWTNVRATKAAIKFFPHHNFGDMDTEEIKYILHDCNCNKLVVPIVSDTMATEFNARFKIIRNSNKIISNDDVRSSTFANISGIAYHFLDIGKMLQKDEAEYNALLQFINEPPLENWKEYCDMVLDEVYSWINV